MSFGTSRKFAKALVADATFALFASLIVGLVLASLSAAGVITLRLAYGCLFGAWLLALAGIFFIDHIWDPPRTHRAIFMGLFTLALIVIGYYEHANVPQPYPTADQIADAVLGRITHLNETVMPNIATRDTGFHNDTDRPIVKVGCINITTTKDLDGTDFRLLVFISRTDYSGLNAVSMIYNQKRLQEIINLYEPGLVVPAFELFDNNFKLHSGNWDVNYDTNKIEVVNGSGFPLLQVIRESDSIIRVNGIFTISDHVFYFGPHGEWGYAFNQAKDHITNTFLRPIFKYPSFENKGKLTGEGLDEDCPTDVSSRLFVINHSLAIP